MCNSTRQDVNPPKPRQPPKDCDKSEVEDDGHYDEHIEERAHNADN